MLSEAINYVETATDLEVYSKGVVAENVDFVVYTGTTFHIDQAVEGSDTRHKMYEWTHSFTAYISEASTGKLTSRFVGKVGTLLNQLADDTKINLVAVENNSNETNAENKTAFEIEFNYQTRR